MPSLQLQSMFQSGPLSSADLSKFTGGAGTMPRASCRVLTSFARACPLCGETLLVVAAALCFRAVCAAAVGRANGQGRCVSPVLILYLNRPRA